MGSVTWRLSGIVAASPDAVWAWLTDFTEDDHNSAAYRRGAGETKPQKKPSRREVVSREGNVIRLRDTWNGSTWEQTVTLDPASRSVRIQGGFGYDATWAATPEGNATRVSVEGRMGKGIVGSIMKLFQGSTQKSMEKDFRGHMEDLRESLKA